MDWITESAIEICDELIGTLADSHQIAAIIRKRFIAAARCKNCDDDGISYGTGIICGFCDGTRFIFPDTDGAP